MRRWRHARHWRFPICSKATGRSRPPRSGFAVSLATLATDRFCRFHRQHARILINRRSSRETCVGKYMQCLEAPMAWAMHERLPTTPERSRETTMKRRDFLKTSAAVAGVAAVGAPFVARTQELDTVNVGHLVGICMSPLFYAKAREYFREEGLNVQMKFMPNPGDALTALNSGAMDIIHNPFTNAFIAAGQGAPVRIIAGSGAGGLFLVAQKETGIKNMADLAAAKGKGLKIGTVRFNTFELTLYRALVKAGVGYSDYDIVWFNDTLALAAAFESKNLDLATHVEPFATRLIDTLGGVPIASSLDAWGPHGPDCVTNTTARYLDSKPEVIKRYLKAILRADAAIKADLPKAVDVLDGAKFYRVNKETLAAALPRQMPQVDITKGGEKGMEIAVADMVQLGYLKTAPQIVDTKLLKQVLA
ncbi:MAG: twin-arginine translocation signal domain-containing protein [Alphaproteobacteria bacterium]|nr:MAG: twin-arginine translocation signal domain-containing protein [Alphaproteobacteria bacterium]